MKKTILSVIFTTIIVLAAYAGQGISFYKAGFPDVAKQVLISDLATEANVAETAFYLGNTFFLEGNAEQAAFYFAKGLAADPSCPYNEIGQAMLVMKTTPVKDMDAKIKSIINKKNYKDYKKNAGMYMAISYAYLYNGMISKALEFQEKAKNINVKNPEVYVLLGDIYEKNDIGQACGYYEMALNYDENCIEAYIKHARAYKSVNSRLAIERLMQLKQKDPSFVLADRELGDTYYYTNDFGKAAEYYDRYLQSGNKTNVNDLVKYSMALLWNKDLKKSVEVALLGLSKDPRNPALNRLLLYNYTELENYDKALEFADKLFNKSDGAVILFMDHTYHARALKGSQKIELAAAAYAKAIEMEPERVDLWKDVSDMYRGVSDYPNAISAYLKYKNHIEKNAGITDFIKNNLNYSLGQMYYFGGRDTTTTVEVRREMLQNAATIFGNFAEADPDNYLGNFWRARANLGIEQIDNKAVGLAKPYYEQTIVLGESKNDVPNTVLIECYNYMASYLFNADNLRASLEYWNKMLKIDPNHKDAKIVSKYIEEQIKEARKARSQQ